MVVTTRRMLVVFYSLTGNTEKVAKDLAQRLDADIESIHDTQHGVGWLSNLRAGMDAWRQKPAVIGAPQRDPADYELTLIGTPVWSWQVTPGVRAYLQQTRGKLRKVAFFITSGNTDISKLLPSLEALAGCKAVASAGFSARELNNSAAYEMKLAEFIHAIRNVTAAAAANNP